MNNQEIIKTYEEGASLASLSRKTGLSVYKIKKILQNNSISIRTRFEQTIFTNMQRGKKINHNYFDVLTYENAYYLGFIAADGCVRPNRNEIKIGLSSIDKEWLKEFKMKLNSEREIEDYITNKGFSISELKFSSLKIKIELAKYSIVPNKTYLGITMKAIPDKYKLAFIKGYFDGDGCFVFNENTKQCSLKITSCTKKILEEISDYFKAGSIYPHGNNFELDFSTLPALSIMQSFYNLDTPCLKRKKEKYLEALKIRIEINPRAKDASKEDESLC